MKKQFSVESHIAGLAGLSKPYRYTVSQGLHLLIKPNSKKVWRLDYKLKERRNTITLGKYEDIDLFEAVKLASKALKNVKNDIDPSPTTRIITPTMAKSTFQEVTAALAKTKGKSWQEKGRSIQLLRNHVFPILGVKPIDEITQAEINNLIAKIASTQKETSIRTRKMIVSVFIYAVEHGICKTNIAR